MGLTHTLKGVGLRPPLCQIYADMIGRTQLGLACIEDAEQYDGHSIDVFLRRVKPYNPNGRNQSEEEAWQLDQKIKSVIPMPYYEYDGGIDGLPTVNKNFHKIHQNLTKFTSTIL